MKTKLLNLGRNGWHMLTDVPGWPDAPRRVRIRRTLPLVIPCLAILLLLGWNTLVRDPRIERERFSRRALLAQHHEIESLKLSCSEQQAAELSVQAEKTAKLVLNDAKELGPVLQDLKKEAADRHWDGNFIASDPTGAEVSPATQLVFLPARAKLSSAAGNTDAFLALLALFERFSTSEKRIDLTRMGIRADEQGRYTVELNLRLVARSPHEKTPQ